MECLSGDKTIYSNLNQTFTLVFADRLPSSAERMEKLNAGRLFEKFGKIIRFITLIQNHYWQQTHFNGNWVGGQKMLGFGRQNLEKPLFLGEAIPQAITSGLYLYNHHDLQVRRLWTFTNLNIYFLEKVIGKWFWMNR